jgi:hypothetical protein
MDVEQIDLNIANYNVSELLNLFNLQHDFNSEDLKKAYKQTLMTHPDKSGLNKEYFLFFSKAFKKVKYLYDFRNGRRNANKRSCSYENQESYNNVIHNELHVDKKLKKQIDQKMNQNASDFNEKFNKLFEEVKIHDEEHDTGYDEWMQKTKDSNENDSVNITNARALNEYIEQKKQQMKSLIVYDGIREMNSSTSVGNISNLSREKPKYYESGLFSKMQYEDYKRAHSETVVPVTNEDYINRQHFNSVDDLMRHRQNTQSVSNLEQANEIMKQKKLKEDEESAHIAYNLTRQMEQIEESNRKFKAKFNLILDK